MPLKAIDFCLDRLGSKFVVASPVDVFVFCHNLFSFFFCFVSYFQYGKYNRISGKVKDFLHPPQYGGTSLLNAHSSMCHNNMICLMMGQLLTSWFSIAFMFFISFLVSSVVSLTFNTNSIQKNSGKVKDFLKKVTYYFFFAHSCN